MVAKKKELYLGLLLSLLGIGNVMQAYRITLKNHTPYKVRFRINYHGATWFSCRSHDKEVAPHTHVNLKGAGYVQ